MNSGERRRWLAVIVGNVVILCVLGFYGTSQAQPNEPNLPFANAVEQRIEIINQLKQLNEQIKEQNALLRSGKLKVVVDKK